MAAKKAAKDENLKDTINPEDIVMDVEDDTEMPQPETKVYKSYLKVTDKFKQLFNKSVGTLPYNTVLTSADGKQIKLLDFVKFVEERYNKIAIDEMNYVISFIANLDFAHARPLMEVVENREAQASLWVAVQG